MFVLNISGYWMLGASHGPEKDISRFYCDSTPFALCDNPPPTNQLYFLCFISPCLRTSSSYQSQYCLSALVIIITKEQKHVYFLLNQQIVHLYIVLKFLFILGMLKWVILSSIRLHFDITEIQDGLIPSRAPGYLGQTDEIQTPGSRIQRINKMKPNRWAGSG